MVPSPVLLAGVRSSGQRSLPLSQQTIPSLVSFAETPQPASTQLELRNLTMPAHLSGISSSFRIDLDELGYLSPYLSLDLLTWAVYLIISSCGKCRLTI